MGGHLDADLATLEQITNRLRSAATSLDAGSAPPEPPEAGACTAAVSAVLAFLTDSAAGVGEGVGAAGNAVAESYTLYMETDQN
ncbi:MAG: hypothetical protein LC799_24570, partial [Actinobacteria bacterium]|nr:hypothetical protein [Actinomycetota bacterium]